MASGKILPTQERKSRKPLIERRRRQKFNNYLEEMKELVLEALHKDSNQYGKMEKADILEMTANYLKTLRRQMSRQNQTGLQNPENYNSYKAGYQDCVAEVSRYLATNPDLHHLQSLELSQNAMRCYPVPSDVTSPIPSPTLQSSTQVLVNPMFGSLPSPQGNFYSQVNNSATRLQYSPPSSPVESCYSPEPVKVQFRYPTPPPSPSSPNTQKELKFSPHESSSSSSVSSGLWRPWC